MPGMSFIAQNWSCARRREPGTAAMCCGGHRRVHLGQFLSVSALLEKTLWMLWRCGGAIPSFALAPSCSQVWSWSSRGCWDSAWMVSLLLVTRVTCATRSTDELGEMFNPNLCSGKLFVGSPFPLQTRCKMIWPDLYPRTLGGSRSPCFWWDRG